VSDTYDFSGGRRGRVTAAAPEPAGKAKVTIRLDQDIVDRFLAKADESGGSVDYQTLINDALRRAIREELKGRHDAA